MLENKNGIDGQIRQGDVLVEKIGKLPKVKKQKGYVILAHGEATGHAHRIRTGAEMLLAENGDKYLKFSEITELVHEEHSAIPFTDLSDRVVIQQRTYTPEEIPFVKD